MAMNYWLSLPFATTYRFIKHYPTIEELRTKIIHHAFKHNIVIIGNGDELNMENLMANRRITRKKRSLSPRRSVSASAAAKRLKTAPSAAPIAQEQAQAQLHEEQAQAQLPITNAQAQLPITNAQVPIAPPSGHLPNANGARRFVPNNTLVLNGLVIEVDPDTFMVNATQMCKAAGKEYFDYAKTAKAKSFLQAIESKPIFVGLDLIQSKPGHNGGTMVHRLIAYDLASWLSGDIKLQFYMWNDELQIENAAMSTQIKELQANAADSACAAHLPTANGVRRVVPTNTLVLNGLVIEVDPDTFMVNATQMCKAAGKMFGDYHRQKKTEDYLQGLSLDMGIHISKLVQRNQSGRGLSQDTTVHFLVALHLAYWLSTEVQVQFSKWIGELRNENAALSTQIEELQATAADSASATVITTTSAHLPNVNGARRFVPTNTLVLNGLVIEVDPDTFMVNATQMCKAAQKLFGDYYRQKKTDEYLQGLSNMGIPIFDLIQSKPGHNGGTMVHRLIAYDLASWLSGDIKLQFYMWNDELLLTGRVELGKEMNVQQLEESWRRINEEVQAKASADLSAERERCQEIILQRNELELQLATMEEDHRVAEQHNKALVAIKTREDLEAAIQFQVNTTAPTIATYKEGDNVLYLARIDETKYKYGHTKNLKQRLEAHTRPGAYPTFELVWIVKSNNGVASEDQLHAYVKKTKIGVEYGNQREVVVLESVEALQRMMNKMQKCCRQQQTSEGSEVVLRRIKAKTSIKMKKIDARVDMEKIKAELEEKKIAAELEEKKMDVGEKNKDREMKKLQMVLDGLINFDQFLLIK